MSKKDMNHEKHERHEKGINENFRDFRDFRAFRGYKSYKPSGEARLGDVPEHWGISPLKFVCRFAYGDSLSAEDREDGDYAVYGSNGAVGTHNKANTLAPVIIVGRKGSYGKLNFSDKPVFSIDTTYFIDSRLTKQSLLWLKYALQPLKLDEGSKDSAVPGLAREDAYINKIPLPPLPEQQSIAAFLDRETGRIDALIAKKERLLELLAEQRTALISRAVTKGLDASVKLKPSGVEWLGDVPEHWETLPLRRIVEKVKTGGTPTGAEESAFDDEGFNWYSPGDFSDNIRLGKSSRALSEEGKQEIRIFPPKTVMLVGIGATIGKVGLAINESSCNQQVNGIICSKRLYPEFATYYMKTLRGFIIKCGKYTTLPIINQDETKNLIFTLPPLPEQQAIAEFLDHETAKINALSAKVTTVIERLKEYRTALISSAVTGKIDVREAV